MVKQASERKLQTGISLGALILAGAFAATPAAAQVPATADRGTASDAAQEGQGTEIVVTAQRRTERLIEVPQSVTVLSGDTLASQGATQFRDFASTVPGLSFQTEGAGFTQISLRGVTVGKDVGATVGLYVDDVPIGSTTTFARGGQVSADVGLFDVDQIEILRGPQGTLYGASAMGGLLKYEMRRPDLDTFGGQVRAGLSDTRFGGTNYEGSLVVNLPIVQDRLALRASAFGAHDAGYVDNILLGERNVNRADIYGGRLDLLFTPTSELSVRIVGYAQNISRDGFPFAEFTRLGAVNGPLSQRRTVLEPFDQEFRILSGTLNYDFGGAELTSITAYQTIRTDFISDLPSFISSCPLQGSVCSSVSNTDLSRTDKFTQEVRLASQGSRTIEWLVGAFYTSEDSNLIQDLILLDANGQTIPNQLFSIETPSTYEEISGFANLTWNITPRFDVTGGIRVSHNKQRFEQTGGGLFGRSGAQNTESDSVVTYLANARYRFSDHMTLYARFATGYRPGGPNILTTGPGGPGPDSFESDSLGSYEIGFKAETPDRRFGLDLSAYKIDWDNIIVSLTINGFASRVNVPQGASIYGGELSLYARPADGLRMTGSLSYQNTELRGPILGNNGLPIANPGEELPTVPDWNANFTADYRFSDGGLQPSVGATLTYVDDRRASFGTPFYTLPDYTTLDLRAGFVLEPVSIQFYVRNLTDARGQLTPRALGSNSTGSTTNPFLISILQPRTIGVSLSANF